MPTNINGNTGIDKVQDGTVVNADIATLDASKLTGTVAPARLGSGSAGSGNFLRGDGSWQTAGSTSASDLTSGTLPDARFPSTLPAASAANLTAIPAANITGTLPAISAANLTAIPAANITGTLPAISGANLTGISGGLSEADCYRMTTSFNSPNDGASFITQNWERPDTYGAGYVGTGMSEAAGVWTFPSTGIWLVTFNVRASSPADARYITGRINTTTNNSSYSIAAIGYGSLNPVSSYWYTNIRTTFMFDVTNVSTHKVKFSAGGIVNDVGITGDTNQNETYVTFLKLGET